MAPPALDDDLRLPQRVEDFAVEEFVSEPGIEGLDVAVLPGTTRGDIGGPRAHGFDPPLHGLGDELGTITHREGDEPRAVRGAFAERSAPTEAAVAGRSLD